jgi:signal-transduction protein with cAMP-binding, CBS, and nucleotidyltransferase domain
VDGWLARSETKDLFYTDIFFDFRSVLGEASLARELWRYAYGQARQSPGFLRDLAGIATGFRSPIGFFGNIKTESGRLDLKQNGLLPIVTGARVLALRNDIEERATWDRLEGVRRRGIGNEGDIKNILDAHELFLHELLMQQLEDIEAGVPPVNSITIKRLSRRRRSQLKQALHQIDAMHSLVGDPVAFG